MNAALTIGWIVAATGVAADEFTVSPATTSPEGFRVHAVQSPFQQGKTQIRVLPPENLPPGELCPVVYVLPVEAKTESHYGDGLAEVKKLNLHERHRAIFVAPTFSHLPWYADHPTIAVIRQETYFIRVVLPFVEGAYPVKSGRDSRLLVGFSKSGWGAWSLLLRHPDVFGRAAAWDAPLMMDQLGKYGTTPIFGTQENLERYKVQTLLREQAISLGAAPRLVLTGYGNFRSDQLAAHVLLEQLQIPHVFRDGPLRKHDWHSGWLAESVELLLQPELP